MRHLVRFYNKQTDSIIHVACLSIAQFAQTKSASTKQVIEAVELEDVDYSIIGNTTYILMTKKSIKWTKDRYKLYCKIAEIETGKLNNFKAVQESKPKEEVKKEQQSPWG